MSLTLITAPTEEPVSLDEFKGHARIDGNDEDADITYKLLAARLYVEGELHRALVTSTWKLRLCHWPAKGYIELPLGNLQTVTSVTYREPGALVQTTWAATGYSLSRIYPVTAGDCDAGKGSIYHVWGGSWPPGPLDVGEPIEITFTCGWKDPASVPAPIKAAIMLLAAHWYRNREAVTIGNMSVQSAPLALAVDALLSRYKFYD